MIDEITTEELQLTYRVVDVLADECTRDTIEGLVLCAAAEILRAALRSRTIHDPIAGQLAFDPAATTEEAPPR